MQWEKLLTFRYLWFNQQPYVYIIFIFRPSYILQSLLIVIHFRRRHFAYHSLHVVRKLKVLTVYTWLKGDYLILYTSGKYTFYLLILFHLIVEKNHCPSNKKTGQIFLWLILTMSKISFSVLKSNIQCEQKRRTWLIA